MNKVINAINDIKNGKMVIVVDHEDRENEGDFIMSAEKATADDINFMMKYGRGLICMPITNECAKRLELDPMVSSNTSMHATNFTVSVDAIKNATTGISSKDRWETVQIILDKDSKPSELGRPGHLFPIVGKDGGVLQRAGHTEASMDLCKLAGLDPAALIVEIVDEDGTMARGQKLIDIAKKYDMSIISVQDLISYKVEKEKLVEELSDINLPTAYGDFSLKLFEDKVNGDHHLAIMKGEWKDGDDVLVRVHSQCLTGDILKSLRCDCGEQLDAALKKIDNEGRGLVVYLRQEGRGIGLKNKILAYKLQEEGYDTVEANEKLGFPPDLREYGIGAQIIKECGITRMRLMTNNPKKIIGLEGYGLEVVGRESLDIIPNENNKKYLKTKKDKLGHFILGENNNEK
ncbi:bifunctional 3,4-dihydroxy-2-butanone-4-phosphate synthase/GTP cyclohydrolase II [Candidatus Marinimicrobia bacterium]|nr:bifunctional 3,4-dihydroxy-2-butanone-4-phosphate synthase/GTP cyclohydrolase II [Candidatus Neomarinimicrobiota bacterium]|tara:strand:- start:1972 stop:3183 length:1212 start_codon:yes stop_codon:yes gene_type:complete